MQEACPVTAQPADARRSQFALEATRRAEEAEARLEELLDVLDDTGSPPACPASNCTRSWAW